MIRDAEVDFSWPRAGKPAASVFTGVCQANHAFTPKHCGGACFQQPTLAANAKAKTYGEANPALDAVVTGGVPGGDPIAYTLDTTATQFSFVGDYPIEVTLGSNPNYSVAASDSTLTITPAELTVTIHDPASGQLNRVNDPILLNGSFTLTGVAGDYAAYWTFSSATLEPYSPYSIWAAINQKMSASFVHNPVRKGVGDDY